MSEQNGTSPAAAPAAEEECADCVSNGEKLLAVLSLLFGAAVVLMAIDMFTGGKLTGLVKGQAADVSG